MTPASSIMLVLQRLIAPVPHRLEIFPIRRTYTIITDSWRRSLNG
jgi:hypothetical protein